MLKLRSMGAGAGAGAAVSEESLLSRYKLYMLLKDTTDIYKLVFSLKIIKINNGNHISVSIL